MREKQSRLFLEDRERLMSRADQLERIRGKLRGFGDRQRVRAAIRAKKSRQRRERLAIRADEAEHGPRQRSLLEALGGAL